MQTTTTTIGADATQTALALALQTAAAVPAAAVPAAAAAVPAAAVPAAAVPAAAAAAAAAAAVPAAQKQKQKQKASAAPVVVATPVNFRLVVRGSKTAGGPRLRFVKNVPAVCVASAYNAAMALAPAMCAPLYNPTFNVYPPVGEKCNGQPSKGFAIIDGMVVKTAVTA